MAQMKSLLDSFNGDFIMMDLPYGFSLVRFSDLDYEGPTVEIQFLGQPFAQINRDKGKDKQEIAVPARFAKADSHFNLSLKDLVKVILVAEEMLAEME